MESIVLCCVQKENIKMIAPKGVKPVQPIAKNARLTQANALPASILMFLMLMESAHVLEPTL